MGSSTIGSAEAGTLSCSVVEGALSPPVPPGWWRSFLRILSGASLEGEACEAATACRLVWDKEGRGAGVGLRRRREERRRSACGRLLRVWERGGVSSVRGAFAAGRGVAGGGGRALGVCLWWGGRRERRLRTVVLPRPHCCQPARLLWRLGFFPQD